MEPFRMSDEGRLAAFIAFGEFELNLEDGELRKAGKAVKLQPQPLKLLALLAANQGSVVGRNQIHHCLWGDETFVDFDQCVNHCIRQIRAALGDDTGNPRYVQTLPRRGYRFIGSIEGAPQPQTMPPMQQAGSLGTQSKFSASNARQPLLAVLVACAAFLGIAYWLAHHTQAQPVSPRETMTTPNRTQMTAGDPLKQDRYEAYLEGRFYWNKRTSADLRKSLNFFGRAIQEDPRYALAYAGVADSYLLMGDLGDVPPNEAYAKAEMAVEKALALDPVLAEAHCSLARIRQDRDWNWLEADKEFRLAIRLNPGYSTGHQWYASFLTKLGRSKEATLEAKKAVDLDPLSPTAYAILGRAYYAAGDYEMAITQFRMALDLYPDFGPAYIDLGRVYLQEGMPEKAVALFKQGVAISGSREFYLGELGYAYAITGRKIYAEQTLRRLTGLSSSSYVSECNIALVYVGLGEREEASTHLSRCYQSHDYSFLDYFGVDPRMSFMRSAPGFQYLGNRFTLSSNGTHEALP